MSEINCYFLESLDVPAVTVTPDHTVARSNSRLQKLLGKFNRDLVGAKIGSALNCGCGGPSGCQCGLAAVIDAAHVTRQKLKEVPVLVLFRSGAAALHRVTAMRVGEEVLLMIKASEGGR